ncbi:MAG: type II toxin-antitoxin system HicA family toxin [bacterium]
MPKLKPISWRELVKQLKFFGFDGPYQSGKHPFMTKGDLTLTIPNPHDKEVGVDLLDRILKQAGVSKKDWFGK